jgi:hypothetical protein
MTLRSQTARAYAILASVPPERWASAGNGVLSDADKEQLVSAVMRVDRLAKADLGALASVWPPGVPQDSLKLRELLNQGGPRLIDLTLLNRNVSQLETITLIDTVSIYWEQNAHTTVASGPHRFKFLPADKFLNVGGAGTHSRFDLSPLFVEKTDELASPTPVMRSIEGRKGDLIPLRFVWRKGPKGPEAMSLTAKIVLY